MLNFWIFVIIATILLDIMTSGFMFSVFAIGALCSILCNSINLPIIVQIVVFTIVNIILIITLVPYVKKKMSKSIDDFVLQENRLIGKEIVLSEDLKDSLLINIEGVFWTVKTLSGTIPAGNTVKIVSLEGNKYIVEKK